MAPVLFACLWCCDVVMPNRLRDPNLTIHIVFPTHTPDFAAPRSCECGNSKDRGRWFWQHVEKLNDFFEAVRIGFVRFACCRYGGVSHWVLTVEIDLLLRELEYATEGDLQVFDGIASGRAFATHLVK